MLQQYKRIEIVDFNVRNVAHIRKVRGVVPIEYTMTPKTFFLCLTRSKNSCEYAEYYFHVLEIYDYYEEYYTKMYKEKIEDFQEELEVMNEFTNEQENIIVEKEDAITRLQRRIEEMHNESMTLQNSMQLQLNSMQNTLNKIVTKLDNHAVPPSDNDLTERFVLMKKNDSDSLYVIRTQERRLKKAIREREKLGYYKVNGLIESELNPNSMYF